MKSKDRLTSTQALSREKPSSQRWYPVHSIYFLIWYSTASQKTERIASDACLEEKLKRKRNLYQKEETKVWGLAQKERFCFKLHQKRKMAGWHPKMKKALAFLILDTLMNDIQKAIYGTVLLLNHCARGRNHPVGDRVYTRQLLVEGCWCQDLRHKGPKFEWI